GCARSRGRGGGCRRRGGSWRQQLDPSPRPLWAGVRGRGLAPAGAHDSYEGRLRLDDDWFSGALPRADPAPSPPPTRGGGIATGAFRRHQSTTSMQARYRSFHPSRSLTTVLRYSSHTTLSCTGSFTIAPVMPAARSAARSTPSL